MLHSKLNEKYLKVLKKSKLFFLPMNLFVLKKSGTGLAVDVDVACLDDTRNIYSHKSIIFQNIARYIQMEFESISTAHKELLILIKSSFYLYNM